MKIITHAVLDLETMQWTEVESYDYEGPLALCGDGATSTEKENQKLQNEFMQTMMQESTTAFQEQQANFEDINAAWKPILAAGPNQYGFSAAEDETLQSAIRTNSEQQTANTVNAEELHQQQETGGADLAPSGSKEALDQQARILGGQTEASELSQEKLAGYETGTQLFENASNAINGVGTEYNPVGLSGATNGASGAANQSAQIVQQADSSLLNSIMGGVAGGIANIPKMVVGLKGGSQNG